MATKTFLVVSDTHKAYAYLEQIVDLEGPQADYIVHSGDFANIQDDEKHLPELQEDGLKVYKRTIDILKKAGKPIFCVPGNHDSDRLFLHLTMNPYHLDGVHLLGKLPVNFEGFHFVGLGGAPPGRYNGQKAWAGNPFVTLEQCEQAMTEYIEKEMGVPNTIILTHAPPLELGEVASGRYIIQSGSPKLQEIIVKNAENILFVSSGHKHEPLHAPAFYGTQVINSGSVMYGNYATIKIEHLEGKWKIKEVLIKNL